jgi:hypothetical protein
MTIGRGKKVKSSGGGGGGGKVGGAAEDGSKQDGEEHECCCICLEELSDAMAMEELGEPLVTQCGHWFHAVCFAQHLEAAEQDPWCPMCRGTQLGATFA